jgi:DNA-binding response OmpR family regulator
MLIENVGKSLSRKIILDNLWGYASERYGDTRIVDVNISRLRVKIEDIPTKPNFILTVRGEGYMFKKY